MANPQIEDGYTRIANEIMEALAKTRIPGEARQIVDTILRKTYGWGKKEDRIPLSQFCLATGMPKPTVIRAIKKAYIMNLIIIKKDNEDNSYYSMNKDFFTWKPLSKKITLSKKPTVIGNNDNELLAIMIPSIENTKETPKDNNVVPTPPPKKKKKLINGEIYRGKYQSFDSFLDKCFKKNIQAAISPKKYFGLEQEYLEKVVWTIEVQGCIDWLFDHDKKFISAGRLRNRMKNAIKWAKDRERQRLEKLKDGKIGQITPIIRPIQKMVKCLECGTFTPNLHAQCNQCAENV